MLKFLPTFGFHLNSIDKMTPSYLNLICMPIQYNCGNLSELVTTVIAFINLLVFIYLTCQIHKYNIAKDDRNEMPIISFYYRDTNSYVIENIGLRTAIDVVVYYNIKKDEIEWVKYKNLYAMPPGEKYVTGINSAQHLCAIYQSISGKNHYSYMAGSKLKYFDDKKVKKDFKEEFEIVKSAISK
jgi:hypothetical protein